MLERFVEQLSGDMGLEGAVEAREDGSYVLHFEPDLNVGMKERPESGICFFAVLAPLPEEQREVFLQKLMAANLFGRETGGAALGVDSDGKRLTLSTFLSEQVNYREFHDHLEDFVNYAEAWRAETLEFDEQPTE